MMNKGRTFYRRYVFSADVELRSHQLDQLTANFLKPLPAASLPLGGRLRMPCIFLEPFGAVVVKCYRRGGLMGRFNRWYYLARGPTRGEREFQWLKRMRDLGVNAPEPIVAAHRGRLVNRCWLVTRKIINAASLAELSLKQPGVIAGALVDCARQIDILVENRILHPDLHPGNVLVDANGQVWLIDFDQTGFFRGRRQRLAARYRRRWQRAVRKHRLPPELDVLMTSGRKTRWIDER
jgi:hypothetical protein